jgi:isopentenyldiphosphate isomerase
MNLHEHRERHKELHKAFDELLADFIYHSKDGIVLSKPISELMDWSNSQCKHPTPQPGDSHE